jgi:predicted nucleic acid-binding protein
LILLDTNVLSALMLAEPDPVIVRWLDRLDPRSVWTTAITVFEIRYGLEKRGPGRKTRDLEEAFSALIREDLDGRVAPVDGAAAEAAAKLAGRRGAAGRVVDFPGYADRRDRRVTAGGDRHPEPPAFRGSGNTGDRPLG